MLTISDLEKVARGCDKLKSVAEKKINGAGWLELQPVVEDVIVNNLGVFAVVRRSFFVLFKVEEILKVEYIMSFEEAASILQMQLPAGNVSLAA